MVGSLVEVEAVKPEYRHLYAGRPQDPARPIDEFECIPVRKRRFAGIGGPTVGEDR